MKEICLETPEAGHIIPQLLAEPLVILAGSAISGWEPTCLPVGMDFTKGMFDLLFPSHFLGNDLHLIEHLDILWKKVPFEHLLERCPNHQKLTPIIKRSFQIEKFNPVHEAISEAFIGGKFRGVITTNYDLCLDKLLANVKDIAKVITKDDYKSVDVTSKSVYFKIHGSTDDNEGETLVWALRYESYLEDWKRKLLLNMIKGKSLLIIGYSGLDFEICPEILKMPVKNIFWNILREKDMSPNACRFLQEMPGYFLVGDMKILLSSLVCHPVNATWGKSSNDLLDSIKTEFTECEIGIWRASLLNSMGCASIAFKASKEMLARCSKSKINLVNLRRQKAQALFHAGKYSHSAKEFYKTAKELELDLNSNLSLRIALLLDSCDAYRCHGAFLRAILCLKKARKEIQRIDEPKNFNELKGRSALKEVLIWRHLYQITKALKIQFLTNFIKKKTTNLLQLSSKTSLEVGNWFDFLQVRLWAERMDINPLILANQIPYEPPPPKEGYEHLGYYVAQSMCLRDQLAKTQVDLSMKEEQSLKIYMKNCMEFGNYPELWKLSLIGLRRSPKKREYFRNFLKAFFFCEYTIPMRLFRLVLGG